MVNTCRDAWFEEGARLFYLMPPAMVDHILPLAIRPTPTSIVHAIVGRIELATPEAMRKVEAALIAGDARVLREYGRFLQPIADRALARMNDGHRVALEQRLSAAYTASASALGTCR
jgi:hypothetical protein